MKPATKGAYPFVEWTWLWVTISFIAIGIGIAFFILNFQKYHAIIKPGIDFSGGLLLDGTLGNAPPVTELLALSKRYSKTDPIVQVSRQDKNSIHIRLTPREDKVVIPDIPKDLPARVGKADEPAKKENSAEKPSSSPATQGGTENATAPSGTAEPPTEGEPKKKPPEATDEETPEENGPTGPIKQTEGMTPDDIRGANSSNLRYELGLRYGGFKVDLEEYVGPVVGRELTMKAFWAVIIASVLILIYVAFRFSGFDYGIGGVLALVHDVLIIMGGSAIASYFFNFEMDASFIAVVLTIIGFSINDTIIIFDRIRENLRLHPELNFPYLCNLSLTQTLARSIYTVLTVVIALVALIIFGGENLRFFSISMLIGMVSGSYSSIFIATPIVLLFRRGGKPATELAVGGATAGGRGQAYPIGTTHTRPTRTAPTVESEEEYEIEEEQETVGVSGEAGTEPALPRRAEKVIKPKESIKKRKKKSRRR